MRSAFLAYLAFALAAVMIALTIVVTLNNYGDPALPPVVLGLGTIVAVICMVAAFSSSSR